MDREQMKLAILKQEQTFRQQVHELHRLYHVQKQLMQQQTMLQQPAASIINLEPKQEFQILHREKPMRPGQFFSVVSSRSQAAAAAPAPPAEDCSLELTLATGGPASATSSGGTAKHGKRLKSASNKSDSGTTVSSTSTESELALFGGEVVDVTRTVRFQSEGTRRIGDMGQGAWMYQCLSLKTA